MDKKLVTLNINGKSVQANVHKKDTLLFVLREELGLKGAKYGCGTGDCDACKVIIDGEAKNACVTPAIRCEGKIITTIEGIGNTENPHPIQEAFVETHAVQCGFCTPGMVVSAKALLDRNSKPTREEIREALKNNICRCTGYEKIVDAIELAASKEVFDAE